MIFLVAKASLPRLDSILRNFGGVIRYDFQSITLLILIWK